MRVVVRLRARDREEERLLRSHYEPIPNGVHNHIIVIEHASEAATPLRDAHSEASSSSDDSAFCQSDDDSIGGLHACPSLALQCMIAARGFSSVDRRVQRRMAKTPWTLNHIHRVLDCGMQRVLARQAYYAICDVFPLLSYDLTTRESDVLRVTIFVNNMAAMLAFYGRVLDRAPRRVRHGLYHFELDSIEMGVSLELALKSSPHLRVFETTHACIQIVTTTPHDWVSEDHVITQDPDGNAVHIVRQPKANAEKWADDGGRGQWDVSCCSCGVERQGTRGWWGGVAMDDEDSAENVH